METRNGRVLVEFKQTRQIMTIKEEISQKHTSTRLAKTFKSSFSVCNECVNTQVFFFFINQVFFLIGLWNLFCLVQVSLGYQISRHLWIVWVHISVCLTDDVFIMSDVWGLMAMFSDSCSKFHQRSLSLLKVLQVSNKQYYILISLVERLKGQK